MVATTDAASAAGIAIKQLKVVLMAQQADFDGACANRTDGSEILIGQLGQAVAETTAMLEVAKERIAYSKSMFF